MVCSSCFIGNRRDSRGQKDTSNVDDNVIDIRHQHRYNSQNKSQQFSRSTIQCFETADKQTD